MSRTLSSPRHAALWAFLIEKRNAAGLSQYEVAARVGRYQSYVARIESGQRRIDAVELVKLAEAIGFDPAKAIRLIQRTPE